MSIPAQCRFEFIDSQQMKSSSGQRRKLKLSKVRPSRSFLFRENTFLIEKKYFLMGQSLHKESEAGHAPSAP